MEENRLSDESVQMALHEVKKVWGVDRSSEAMWSSWERDSKRRARLTVLWILADAFFKKCGYKLPAKEAADQGSVRKSQS